MFKIIIHVFQKDFICILMKYYFNVYDHNSRISNWKYLHKWNIIWMFKIIIHVFQKDFIGILI